PTLEYHPWRFLRPRSESSKPYTGLELRTEWPREGLRASPSQSHSVLREWLDSWRNPSQGLQSPDKARHSHRRTQEPGPYRSHIALIHRLYPLPKKGLPDSAVPGGSCSL